MLKNKNVLLGVTGSVAAHKAVDLARRLREQGASVKVIMTEAAKRFVTPLSFEIASQNKVYSDVFEDPMSHITVASAADLMVIAPATANIIGKFANGIADDMLSTSFLSFGGKMVIAPAMNWRMYENPVFQKNLGYLLSMGVIQVGPEKGSLACGDNAVGRMSEVSEIIEAVRAVFSRNDLMGKNIMVTAGPTREYIDPVRFISNRSSGKTGYAIASAALRRGARVMLISGPSRVKPPLHATYLPVETTAEMRDAVMKNLKGMDAVIMTAAVADFSPQAKSVAKLERSGGYDLKLRKTHDILAEIGSLKKRPFLVGFAAETGPNLSRAKKKLSTKNADMIVFNNVMLEGSGFDVDTNKVTLIDKKSESSFPLMTKDEVADLLLDRIANLI